MNKTILLLTIIVFCIIANFGFAEDTNEFQPKDIIELKKLDGFKNVSDFEQYLKHYIQSCLDSGFGGTASIPCLTKTAVWERDLDLIYNKLYSATDNTGKSKLTLSQKAWLKHKESSLEFSYYLINKKYPKQGTMYYLLRAGDEDDIKSSIVKDRVVFLRSMYEEVLREKDYAEEKSWEEELKKEDEKDRLLEEKMYEEMLKEDSN